MKLHCLHEKVLKNSHRKSFPLPSLNLMILPTTSCVIHFDWVETENLATTGNKLNLE
jgi:hypothetical protein